MLTSGLCNSAGDARVCMQRVRKSGLGGRYKLDNYWNMDGSEELPLDRRQRGRGGVLTPNLETINI